MLGTEMVMGGHHRAKGQDPLLGLSSQEPQGPGACTLPPT